MIKTCLICKSTFETSRYDGSKLYCSHECFKIRKRQRQKNLAYKYRNYMIDTMRDRRKKAKVLGIQLKNGDTGSVEMFSNLAIKDGHVVAAVELRRAIAKCKK